MEFLPTELENIILIHKYQLDHEQKFRKCLRELTSNYIYKCENNPTQDDINERYDNATEVFNDATEVFSNATKVFSNATEVFNSATEHCNRMIKYKNFTGAIMLGTITIIITKLIKSNWSKLI